jgi:hypothetical protein
MPAVTTPPGRVDVQADVLLGVLGLEEQHLGDDHVGHVVVDRADQEDHPLLQQARVDVVGALAAAGLFDHHRHEVQALVG